MELAVSYQDDKHHYREDVFLIPCHESFLWDKADASSRAGLQGRLDYDSYTCNGIKLFYKYILSFFAELFEAREIKVATIPQNDKTLANYKTTEYEPATLFTPYLPAAHHLTQIPIEGEIFLDWGKPKEIGDVKFFLTEFKYLRRSESVILEGTIKSEIEYWDDMGYLRRETGVFTFLRLLRDNFNEAPATEKHQPVIQEYSYFLTNDRGIQKKSLKVIIQLNFNQKRSG